MERQLVNVLVVEGDEEDYLLTRDLLSQIENPCYHIDRAAGYASALEAVGRQAHDVYLVAYSLGAHDGLEFLRQAQAMGCRAPLILLAGQRNEAADPAAVQMGAADFLVKSQIQADSLDRSIRHALDRTRAEERLRASGELWQSLWENVRDAILVTDADGRILMSNRMITGLAVPDVIGTCVFDYLQAEDHERVRKALKAALATGALQSYETCVPTPRREGAWFETRIVAVQSAGERTEAIWISMDITERKRSESRLQQALAWQQAIFEGSRDAIFISDSDSRFTAVNAAACQLTGYTAEELLAMRIPDLHDKADLKAYLLTHDRIMGGDEILTEARIRTKDGRKVDTEFNNRRISVEGVPFMHTTARDVTERTRAEDEIRRLAAIVECADDAIISNTLDGVITSWNMGAEKVFGYERDEVLGRRVHILARPDRQEQVSKALELVGQGKHIEHHDTICRRKNGDLVHVSFSFSPILDAAGQVVGESTIARDITETIRREHALRENQAQLAGILANSPDAIYAIDLESGRVEFLNREEFCGYSKDELTRPGSLRDLGHPDDLVSIRENWQDAMDGRPHPLVFRIRTKGGKIEWAEQRVSILGRDSEGKARRFMVTLTIVTERKRAEEALRESEERYRLLFENSLDAVLLTAPDGSIFSANPAACRMLGRSEEDILAIGRGGVLDRSDPRLLAALDERARTGKFFGELTCVRKDGSSFPVEISTSIFGDRDGRSRTSMIIRDITGRKEAEEALRRSQIFLDSIIEHSPIAMWISDSHGTMLRLNRACRELLHIRPEEVVGRYNVLQDNVVREQGFLPIVQRVYDRAETARFTLRYDSSQLEHLDLAERVLVILDVTISPVVSVQGQVTNAIIQHIDITEQTMAEEHLRVSLREKEVLLKEIHHRVKNNLQVISSLLYLQSTKIKDERLTDIFRDSQNRVASMALIHEKLYQAPSLAQIDFGAYVQELAESLYRSYGVEASRIALEIEADHLTLDITQAMPCGLIVNEIVSNSIKHAFPGERRGTIRVGLALDSLRSYRLTLSDDGVGLPADFDERARNSLGIKLVERLAGQIEGAIDRESSERGTTYRILFPRRA